MYIQYTSAYLYIHISIYTNFFIFFLVQNINLPNTCICFQRVYNSMLLNVISNKLKIMPLLNLVIYYELNNNILMFTLRILPIG